MILKIYNFKKGNRDQQLKNYVNKLKIKLCGNKLKMELIEQK